MKNKNKYEPIEIAEEIYDLADTVPDEMYYKFCINEICKKLNIQPGPIPDKVYEIWAIIENLNCPHFDGKECRNTLTQQKDCDTIDCNENKET